MMFCAMMSVCCGMESTSPVLIKVLYVDTRYHKILHIAKTISFFWKRAY